MNLETIDPSLTFEAVSQTFSGKIDPYEVFNYEGLSYPNYITKDNTGANSLTNEGATLGRVLFYDKALSVNNNISCASCHQQQHAFSDVAIQSEGVAGVTGRHSMRLINARFADEENFFWDERANSLEAQTTQPIQDHIEMGFSGADGDPSLNDLVLKLSEIPYYSELFEWVYGDTIITEDRMQKALAQFVRSIQSFDTKFDEGLAQSNNLNGNFTNYTAQENLGKQLFLDPPNRGGAGCQGCHRAPEFDIDPNSGNNGVIGVLGSAESDLNVTRAPSLRDVFNGNGELNGALMHDASLASMLEVVEHYNQIQENNTNLDNRLRGPNGLQNLGLTDNEKEAIVAFLKTLSGSEVYVAEQWSDPF